MSEFMALWAMPALATVGTLVALLYGAAVAGVWDRADDDSETS